MYNLSVRKIYEKNGIKYFFISNKKIYIEEINDDQLKQLEEIVAASNELNHSRKNSRVILRCLTDKYYFKYKNKTYILSYNDFIESKHIIIDDIIPLKVNNSKYENLKINTIEKWKKIIDEIEKSLVEYNKEYKELMKYINYYIGISENAIQLYERESTIIKNEEEYLEHYTSDYNNDNYLSPLNIKKINIGILFGKYIKYKLYNGTFTYEILGKIKPMIKSKAVCYMLLSTSMFQDEFFDEVKKMIINDEKDQEKELIKKYISKISDLESVLRYIESEIVCEQIINWLEE